MIFNPIDFLFVTTDLVFTTIDHINEEPKTSYAVNFIIVATFFVFVLGPVDIWTK